MKKVLLFICFVLALLFVGCKSDKLEQSILDKVPNYFMFPYEVDSDLEFPLSIILDGKEINLIWHTSNQDVISQKGVVTHKTSDTLVTITVDASFNNEEKSFELMTVLVKGVKETYRINYDLDGGLGRNLVMSYSDGDVVNLPAPTKDGYVFIGWYQGNEKITTITKGNYNLVAKWLEGTSDILISLDEEKIYIGTEAIISVSGYNSLSCFDITSSNEDVAYVDSDYFLIGLKKGKTTITLTLRDNPDIYGSLEVEVLNKNPYIYRDNTPLIIGDEFNVKLSRYDDESLFDISYDSDYLRMDNGMFKTLKVGTTEIKYTLKEDPTAFGVLDLTIYPVEPVLSISSSEVTIGATTRIDILNYPNDEKINISINDVGELSGRLIEAKRRGDITITVSLKEDSSISSSIIIHVKPITPEITLTQCDIIVGAKSYLFFENIEELDDTDINNYDIILSNDDVVSENDFCFTGLRVGTVEVTIKNIMDSEISSSIILSVIDNPTAYDDENEICEGMLYIYHKSVEDFDGYIHAGDMDYFQVFGAHDQDKYDWISTDHRIITVFEGGRYIGISKGEAAIMAVRKTNHEVVGKITVRVYGEPNIDYIGRLIEIASSQLGYREGPNNDTKYGTWYGLPNEEWCAMFVSWCANQSGISSDIIPKYAGCEAGRRWFEERGQFMYKEEYTPKAGDIIFFLSDGAGHTGIVINCDGNYVYTIEGNTSDMCAKRSYPLNWHTITGYGVPNYPPYSGESSSGDTSGSTEGGGHSTH